MFQDSLNLFEEIKKAQENRGRLPDTAPAHLYPSSASVNVTINGSPSIVGGCNRCQFLRMKYESPSDTGYISEDIGPAEVGNLLQDYVEKELFQKSGLFIQSELKVYLPQWNVSGRIDTILRKEDWWIPIDGGWVPIEQLNTGVKPVGQPAHTATYYGVEVKSKSGYGSESKYIRPKKSTIPTEFRPADEHILQAMTYLYACRTIPSLQKYKINKWFIFYVLREDGKYNYFEVELTDFDNTHGFGYPVIYSHLAPQGFIYKRLSIDGMIKRWEELNFCIRYNILPDRDYVAIYPPAMLSAMLAAGDDRLNKENKELIAAGKFSQCMTAKGTANERPLGDFECYTCPYRSKCWGMNNLPENSFDCMKPGAGLHETKYSKFDPFTSKYFDRLTDDNKELIRKELNV